MNITQDPIPGLIRKIAIPASLGFFFNTMFNVVDTYYAGQLSTDSLAALSLSFPMFFILLSVGIGIQSGAGALIANALGAGENDRAVRLQVQAITLAIGVTIVFAVPLFLLLPTIFTFLGAEDAVLAGGLRYMRVIAAGGVVIVVANTLNAGLQARGETRVFRNLLITISILNVIIDPALMFGITVGEVTLIPRLEEAGTALATVGLYGVGIVYLLSRAKRIGVFDGVQRSYFFPDRTLISELVQQSLPASLNFMIMTLGSFVIIFFISRYGRDPIAAYGAALRIEQIALLPLLGINVALATLTGQNNGAARLDRVRESLAAALKAALFVTVLILPPVLIAAPWLLGLFTETTAVVNIGKQYLYIQGITFFSYILINLANSIVQGLKRPAMIMWVGLYRQIAAPFVVFPLLAVGLALEETGVFWGLAIVNWTAALFSFWYARRVLSHAEARVAPVTRLETPG
ncbi:MAG: MATE family efflux transporter [Spirochaeta sp.]|nr:MATE family efflux transporter [Spirochaeta sp.]